tara:strand:+ start:405 stop:662 length:258 start_codon:yes stop_codon:yes gene_type:complete
MSKKNQELVNEVKKHINMINEAKNNLKINESKLNNDSADKLKKHIELDTNVIREMVKSWIKINGKSLASSIIEDLVRETFNKNKP